jgi:hypothetical protein
MAPIRSRTDVTLWYGRGNVKAKVTLSHAIGGTEGYYVYCCTHVQTLRQMGLVGKGRSGRIIHGKLRCPLYRSRRGPQGGSEAGFS